MIICHKFICITRIAVEYLNEAKQKIKDSTLKKAEHEKGILEKVLEINEALAKPVAIDTLAAGIDTVNILINLPFKGSFIQF